MTNIRQLTYNDLPIYKAMQTSLDQDYMIDAFERLVTPPNNQLFGLFSGDQLISVAGYTLFPGGYAMLGRLRSDIRFRKNGYATHLLRHIIDHLKMKDEIIWIGGNTNIGNLTTRRLLSKLGFNELKTLHGFPLIRPDLLLRTAGPVWSQIDNPIEKRHILNHLAEEKILDVYPYECFYPFPYREALIPDKKLAETRFYQNDASDRWLIISDDQKGDAYAQVRYFWDDYFSQAGLFETVVYDLNQGSDARLAWFDFTPEAFDRIPNLDAFEVSDGWVLYGDFIK